LRSRLLVRLEDSALIELGRRVLRLEASEVSSLAQRLDGKFARAVRLLAQARGRVIVSGVGKSGLIARKLAATLTSTGTAASYLHPIDSLHGDLGIVGKDDVAIVLSNSGESQDLFALVGSLQRLSVPIIAITGAMDSALPWPWPWGTLSLSPFSRRRVSVARSSRSTLQSGTQEEAWGFDFCFE
jgi:arabinose-5-phosphate isomerase